MDYEKFSKVIFALAGNFGATIEPATLDIWYDILVADGVTYQQLQQAAQKIIRSKKDGYGRLPTYAELLEAIRGQQPQVEDVALVEANKILNHLRINGARAYPCLDDPVTRLLMTTRWEYYRWASQVAESELKWWVKEFCEAYRATNICEQICIPHEARTLLEHIGASI